MNETYQEEMESKIDEPAEINFATIGAVYVDGVSLIFDGQEEATEKHYKCNSFAVFAAGDRVKIAKDSGTYVVEYPIGNPRTSFTVDTANTANNALKLNGKTESNLSVASAGRAGSVVNQYGPSYESYDIQLQTDSSGNYYIRRGSMAWKKITVT